MAVGYIGPNNLARFIPELEQVRPSLKQFSTKFSRDVSSILAEYPQREQIQESSLLFETVPRNISNADSSLASAINGLIEANDILENDFRLSSGDDTRLINLITKSLNEAIQKPQEPITNLIATNLNQPWLKLKSCLSNIQKNMSEITVSELSEALKQYYIRVNETIINLRNFVENKIEQVFTIISPLETSD